MSHLCVLWRAFLEFMAGIDGTAYKNSIPETPTARASGEKHLRNDQGTYNELELKRYAQGKSDVLNVGSVRK